MEKQITVYDFAKACMKDPEFNKGGIPKSERKWLDEIGFEYTVKDGCVYNYGEDLDDFYKAMTTLCNLQRKYSK